MSKDNSFSFAYTITIFLLVLSRTPSSTNAGPIDFDVYSAKNDPDCFRHTPELIESRGFVSETHNVTTADKYILTLFRIVNPALNETERKRPIILQHGLFSSSTDWILNSAGGYLHDDPEERERGASVFQGRGVGRNIGFELAKRGYDVWLPNSRGNFYSRNHTGLPFKNPFKAFWDFSFDQMIEFDQPAVIDYILETTGRKTVGYAGHSQGTLTMFGLLSTQPKYNDIIKPFIALAPVGSMARSGTSFKYLAKIPWLEKIMMSYMHGEFLPKSRLTRWLASTLCASRVRAICSNIMFMANGWSTVQLNHTRLPVYLSHFPAGTSSKNLVHYGQAVKSGVFSKFDYGQDKNSDIYGFFEPPDYQWEKITNQHIALFHSHNDLLATPSDVSIFRARLQVRPVMDYIIPVKDWNHLDFILARDTGIYVISKMLELFLKYDNEN